ncbi:uncharacterized protein LOC100179254 [Ciona intestinalis]
MEEDNDDIFVFRQLQWPWRKRRAFIQFAKMVTQVAAFLFLISLTASCQNTEGPLYYMEHDLCPLDCTCWNSNEHYPQHDISAEGTVVSCIQGIYTTWPVRLPRNTVRLILEENQIEHLASVPHFINNTKFRMTSANLTSISLSGNHMQRIDQNAFIFFSSLRHLNLSHNQLEDLSWTVGLEAKPLTSLDVSHNSITVITSTSLKKLAHLKWFSISDNHLVLVEPASFRSLTNLHYLDLSFNQLNTKTGLAHDCLIGLKSLDQLSLAGNRIMANIPIFKSIGLLGNSTVSLDLHGMPLIKEIKRDAFRGFGSLRYLNLSYCGIETIQPGWLDNGPQDSIKTLDLSYNRLVVVESHFFLSIKLDPVFDAPMTFGLPLSESSLSYIVSPSINEAVADLSSSAFSYHVTTVASPALYNKLPRLEWLSLRNNRHLSFLADDAFTYVPALKYLFLQSCNLTRINLAASKDIYKDDGVMTTLPNLAQVWLYQNPIFCDCHVRALRHSLSTDSFSSNGCQALPSNTTGVVLDGHNYWYEGQCRLVIPAGKSLCYLPQNVYVYYPISTVPMSYLNCPEEPISLIVASLIGPITFAISIFLVMFCGSCSVLVHRIRRYKSGVYHIISEQRALRSSESTSSEAHQRILPQRSYLSTEFKPSSTVNPPPPIITSQNKRRKLPPKESSSGGRVQYRTNLVLSSMARSGENLASKQNRLSSSSSSSSTDATFNIEDTEQCTSCSKYQQNSQNNNSPQCLHKATNLSDKGFHSCPNVFERERPERPAFWKHKLPLSRPKQFGGDIEMMEFLRHSESSNIPFVDDSESDRSGRETSGREKPLLSAVLGKGNMDNSTPSRESEHLLT